MTAERESMTLQEMGAPALGVEERRDEAPRAGASHARPTPDPEVVAKPKRRKFTAQYRLRILEEAESCTQPGEVGRLLRREGLVRQANWQKVGGASPPERRSNRTTFLREPCVGSREGAGEASVAAWMGRSIEHRKSDGPGCRGFQIGRRQYRRRRFGEMSASPAVSENPCTFARLLLGPWEVFKLPRLS